jgi:L-asparagine oxygenase
MTECIEPDGIGLAPADRRVLVDACRRLGRHDLRAQAEDFVLEAQLHSARLSEGLRRALLIFRRFGHPSGGLLIRNLPTGSIPSTPESADVAVGATQSGAAAMSVLLACLGDQYGFRPELGGNLVQDILPVREWETHQISISSTVDLEAHTEMAFSHFRSDYVALFCLRQDHDQQAGTTLCSIDALLPQLDVSTVDVLSEPRFRTKVDASFLVGSEVAGEVWTDPIRVLNGSPRRPQLRVDFAETAGKDAEARKALAALREAVASIQVVLQLKQGDLLLVDNNRAVHGRTPFVPRYDGEDRWLLRAFVTKDLRRSEIVRPADERIVEPDYELEACV